MYSSRFNQNFVSKEKNQLKVIIVLDEKIHIHFITTYKVNEKDF